MINWKMITRIMGALLFIEAGFLLLCSLFPVFYKEDDLLPFLLSAGITAICGLAAFYFGKDAGTKFGRRDGYLIVTLAWIGFSLFGMLPYRLSGYIPNLTDAFFETMSGFTTTGASTLDNIAALPHGLLFWRSMTQWIGGMGIVFFTIAVLPIFGIGSVQLFAAEATGPTHDKVHPRIGVTAKWIWGIYFGLTAAEMGLLVLGGMSPFDSLCHSLTTTATGGFSTRQSSIATYGSAYIEYVITVFMFLSGISFTLLYLLLVKGNFRKLFHDTEFRYYIGIVAGFTLFTTMMLLLTGSTGLEESFRKAIFQVVAIQTTTGFCSQDYMMWGSVLWTLMCILMLFGACAGSTTGGMKCIRIAIMARVAKNEFKHILHPNAVLPVRINRQVVPSSTLSIVLAFIFIYVVIILVGWIVLMLCGIPFMEAYSLAVSSLNNIGIALGDYGPIYSWNALPDFAKWFCTLLMLAGRLELFTVLLLFSPAFWKEH